MEDPVDAVLVVGRGEDVRDDQFPGAGDDDGVVAEIGVLEEDAGVFLVHTDGVLDRGCGSGTIDKVCVHVMDRAFAVAAESKGIGHIAASVLTQVEGVLSLMRVLRVAVRDHHFGQG